MRFPLAIGAVVEGEPITFQTPLSGQISPVFAVVPIGAFMLKILIYMNYSTLPISKYRVALNRKDISYGNESQLV
jgi:hypothetical protein